MKRLLNGQSVARTVLAKPAMLAATCALVVLLAHYGSPTAQAATPQQQQDCLALALYWEARSEGREGMVAVGWTILNRVRSEDFPSTPCAVVHQGGERPPCQFSWWCDGRSDRPRNQHSWRLASAIAAELLRDPPRDPTGGSLFFHNKSASPAWRKKRTRTATIGEHVFYR